MIMPKLYCVKTTTEPQKNGLKKYIKQPQKHHQQQSHKKKISTKTKSRTTSATTNFEQATGICRRILLQRPNQ